MTKKNSHPPFFSLSWTWFLTELGLVSSKFYLTGWKAPSSHISCKKEYSPFPLAKITVPLSPIDSSKCPIIKGRIQRVNNDQAFYRLVPNHKVKGPKLAVYLLCLLFSTSIYFLDELHKFEQVTVKTNKEQYVHTIEIKIYSSLPASKERKINSTILN